MDTAKDNLIVKKTISVMLVVAILFTCGFLLGALTAKIKSIETPVAVATTEPTTTQPTVTVPETTTTEPTTTTEVTTTTQPTTEATTTTEVTTTAPAETEEEEKCWLIELLIQILEFCKQIKDFLISILESL